MPDDIPEAPTLPSIQSPEGLIAKALEHNVPIETMERLLAMRDKLHAEQARTAFFAALAAFQGACPIIPKSKKVTVKSERGTFDYWYAPLDVIVKTVQPLLLEHGLSHTIQSRFEDGFVVAICTVHHAAGHSESSEFRAPIDKTARMNDIQKTASAQTYAKRYAFCNAHGILSGDDDDDAQSVPAGDPALKPVPLATPADVAQIVELAEAKDVDLDKIRQHYGVDALDLLSTVQAAEAIRRLKATKRSAA